MTPLSNLMNFTGKMTDSDSFFVRNIGSRFIMATACAPLETIVALHNLIKLPYQAAQLAIKIPAKIINVFAASKNLREFESTLASPITLIVTAFKIVAYVVGTIFTLTLGVISPKANFHFHLALGFINDQKVEADRSREQEEYQKQRESHKKIIQTHIDNVLEAKRLKNSEIERTLAKESQTQLPVAKTPESLPLEKPQPGTAAAEAEEIPPAQSQEQAA